MNHAIREHDIDLLLTLLLGAFGFFLFFIIGNFWGFSSAHIFSSLSSRDTTHSASSSHSQNHGLASYASEPVVKSVLHLLCSIILKPSSYLRFQPNMGIVLHLQNVCHVQKLDFPFSILFGRYNSK